MRFYYLLRTGILALFSKKTVGARILLVKDGKLLLVKHTYLSGWYTVGGGVDAGETPRQAIERELQEEVGITLITPPKLFSVYHNQSEKRDDYIVFYTSDDCTQTPVTSPEIAEQQWFSFNELPPDLSPATRRRIEEYLGEKTISERW